MRVALAIAALVAVPITAAADEPAGQGKGQSQGGPTLPTSPAPTLPANPAPVDSPSGDTSTSTTSAPAPTGPDVDPAYGDQGARDVRNFPAPRGKDVVITSYPERSRKNMVVLGAMGAGGVIAGAIGLYFHMDARSATDDISTHRFTGEVWTPEHQATYDRAHSSSVTAGVFYGIGGGLLLATAIAFIATEPKAETMVIHPHTDGKPTALVAPTRGGALVGGAWRF